MPYVLKLTDKQIVTLMMCVGDRVEHCKDREQAEADRPEYWQEEAEKAQALYELIDELAPESE